MDDVLLHVLGGFPQYAELSNLADSIPADEQWSGTMLPYPGDLPDNYAALMRMLATQAEMTMAPLSEAM